MTIKNYFNLYNVIFILNLLVIKKCIDLKQIEKAIFYYTINTDKINFFEDLDQRTN